MVRLNRIYTRTGDDGTTGLVDGSRAAKDDLRIAAIGDVDELNSQIGHALVALDADHAAPLATIQHDLFDLGADLATPGEDFAPSEMVLRIVPAQVERLERLIDRFNESLEPLRNFILPGGSEAAARLHIARSVARRAERTVVEASHAVSINPAALCYLNRLSDLLFVMARSVSLGAGGEVLWRPGSQRDA